MMISLLLLLQSSPPALPRPLTETHMRDIGCVATLGVVADEQRRGIESALLFPNIVGRGRKYAGIVGLRVMDETGQPREVVALAISQSVADQQRLAMTTTDDGARKAMLDAQMATCLPLLDNEVPSE
jgi:hypothetical protein